MVGANTAIRQLIELAPSLPEDEKLKIKLYGEPVALPDLDTVPKNQHPQAKSECSANVRNCCFSINCLLRPAFFQYLSINKPDGRFQLNWWVF